MTVICSKCGRGYDANEEWCPHCRDKDKPYWFCTACATWWDKGTDVYCPKCGMVQPHAQKTTPPAESTLEEAKRLVDGARGGDYGHPLDDFTSLGRIWGAILTRYFEGQGQAIHIPDLTAETVAVMLAAIKINREAARPRRDNIVDLAGYAYTVELITRKREEQA